MVVVVLGDFFAKLSIEFSEIANRQVNYYTASCQEVKPKVDTLKSINGWYLLIWKTAELIFEFI